MLRDGLYRRWGTPKAALALHCSATQPVGTVGYVEGYALASVDSLDIRIQGVGGHGAYPQTTRDPVVLAAQAILALQTIRSREIDPREAVVVTVGSVHGGTKHNIIPDDVRLQLTVRSYTDAVRSRTLDAIRRIVRGQALAAGIPEDRLPEVVLKPNFTPAVYNDPDLTRRLAGVWGRWLGPDRVRAVEPVMGGEDFSEFGRTAEKVPLCNFWLGTVPQEKVTESEKSGRALPSLHSKLYAPVVSPALETGIEAYVAAVIELTRER
jgi:hippurate hydrolase